MTYPKDSLDNMSMLDLFKMEISNQCIFLTDDLAALTDNPNAGEHLSSFQRALHSLKGAARIVDMQAIVTLIQDIEDTVSGISCQTATLLQIIPSLQKVVTFLSDLSKQPNDTFLDWLDDERNHLSSISAVLSKLSSERDSSSNKPLLTSSTYANATNFISQKPDETEISRPFLPLEDLTLFAIFREDAENHCAILNDSLLRLEENPKDFRFLEASMRSTHSIKGAARIIELEQIVQLAHAMEDLFVSAIENKLDFSAKHIDLLLQAVDFLKEFIEVDKKHLEKWYANNISTCSRIIQNLQNSINQEAGRPGQKIPSAKSSLDAPAPYHSTDKDHDTKTAHQPDRHIKISSASMNRLMGLTSEMLAEAKWQPTLLTRSVHLKRIHESLTQQMEDIRKRFHQSHFDLHIEFAFQQLNTQIKMVDDLFERYLTEIEDHALSASKISHKLHKEMLHNKMQPFADGVKGFPRMVRDLSKKLHKQIRFEVTGSETLIDRDILSKIESPLNHLVANAIDHGIETEEERVSQGKTKTATIRMDAVHQAGTLKISIVDDGRGLDLVKLRRTIVEKNLVSDKIAQELSEAELTEFIFLPNFSTKESASHLSGRGVGLDVVHATIKLLRGSISFSSIKGKGSLFELYLPLTLSITRCLTCTINSEFYAFPLVNIESVTKIKQTDLLEVENRQYVSLNDKRVGILSAQQVLDLKEPQLKQEDLSILVLQGSTGCYGLVVDQFNGIKELMVHPINSRLGKLRSVSSASITEDGTPILIMDTQDIIQTITHLISGNRLHRVDPEEEIVESQSAQRILVVDDSATVREVERKLLLKNGYLVTTAVNGLDAWNLVKQEKFNLIVTDIDMPHMDGIEFLLQVREDQNLHNIPVIIVSYKDREEDRLKGLNAGADYYMTKANFQDQTLMDAIYDLIGPPMEK